MTLVPATSAVALTLAGAISTAAQPPAEADPIRCWWRTSAGAVAVGEPFAASLTCAVRADAETAVELDESRLGAATIQLAPFEMLAGSHPADLRTPTHRFVQYHYTLRLISRDAIGRDVAFPDLSLSYRVRTRAAGDDVDGRDRTYVLPGQTVRVLSLVPPATEDIRDAADASFAYAETLRFRARALQLVALALAALGLIVAAPAMLRLLRRPVAGAPDRPRGPHWRTVLAAVARTLASAEQRPAGWTADLVHRTLTATRLTAAAALGRRVPTPAGSDGVRDVRFERLPVTEGWLRRVDTLVASPVTGADVGTAIAALPLTAPAEQRDDLEQLRASLDTLTAALYKADADFDAPALDGALAAVRRSTERQRRAHAWRRSLLTRRSARGSGG
jgi:hypothetical protein